MVLVVVARRRNEWTSADAFEGLPGIRITRNIT